ILTQRTGLLPRERNAATQELRDVRGRLAKSPPLSRERDLDVALVLAIALAYDESSVLEPSQERRQRSEVEIEPRAERADGHIVLFPQRNHDDVLRIRQIEGRQDRSIGIGHRARRRVEREAKLVLELDRVAAGCTRVVAVLRLPTRWPCFLSV